MIFRSQSRTKFEHKVPHKACVTCMINDYRGAVTVL